ncbi:unannotated protein [freshwater metagenome]|uniref:Unannotated protein n=1 Tax=freshwater metagenome TaxID=449393 RepID=A0A6J7QAZ8_9ZZZZ|nr:DUF1775 domain-containing protein [Actinomycetota bacterium]
MYAKRTVIRTTALVAGAFGVLLASASPVSAHMGIELHGGIPTAGSSSTIFLRPGHGCGGDSTNALTVEIPAGVTGTKAQPKAGWKLSTTPTTITWSGGELPDDQFDEFGLRLTWPKLATGLASQKFYFKSVQTCNAELKVVASGKDATVTGWLPTYAGQKAALFVDGIPLTAHDVTIGSIGAFTVNTKSAKVPDGSEVTARINNRLVGTSIAGTDAWIELPVAGSTATLASPAPSVTVIATATTSSH